MIANYHTHSRWCRHGVGEFEDYFEKAISLGFQELAMTEHVPHRDRWSWIPWEEFEGFDRALNAAIEKYRDRITLIKGFECEYDPSQMEDYRWLREELGYNFLILGQHGAGKNLEINSFTIHTGKELRIYADWVCQGLETGLFVMLAHPDVALNEYPRPWDKDCEKAFAQIFSTCERLRIPVELNVNGFRQGRGYPSERAMLFSKNYNLKYLINSDAHDPAFLYDEAGRQMEEWAARMGIQAEERFPWGSR